VIHHTALEAAEADREPLAAFFELLGFRRVEPPATLAGALWLECSGTQLHVLFVEDAVVSPQGHVAVVCPGYDAVLARLRDAGFEPESRREHWGSPRCFVRAPGGHRVEIMARPPLAGATRSRPRPRPERP
jgi:catechol 2,3-dioxygenase-like lactoylglutathione lyase family enzyme